jgi:hypothetical protein
MFVNPAGLELEKDCENEAQKQLNIRESPSRQGGRPTSTNLQLSQSNKSFVVGSRRVPGTGREWLTDYQL